MTVEAKIIVVDDEAAQRELLAEFLRGLGAEVLEAGDGAQAFAMVQDHQPDLVITDVRMPNVDGHALLRRIKACNPAIEVLVVTAYAAVRGAVACLKEGAADYLLKPLDLDEVEHLVLQAIERRHLRRENSELRRRLGEVASLPGIITAGGEMTRVLSTVGRVAPSEASVLILGESGTGKELLAGAIHAASLRADGPFVAVNGASLSPHLLESELFGHERGAFTGAERLRIGRLERAAGGTLFLDEIGDLPPEVQVKLLRVLQERTIERVGSSRTLEVDVRVVSATHRDLAAEVAAGSFREDLFYRLAVVTVELPPLRRRRADIPLLVEHFRDKHGRTLAAVPEFSRQAMDRLVSYDYPGNVRELENIVQRSLVMTRGDLVTVADLPPAVRAPSADQSDLDQDTLGARVAALERSSIEDALQCESNNQSAAGRRLGLSERALRYKLKKYGIRRRG